jgi:ketosteroid isomerase-like protein
MLAGKAIAGDLHALYRPRRRSLALRELLETYADAVTRCDAQAWGDTWAEDAQWSLPDYPEIGTTQGAPRSWRCGPKR